MNLRAFIRDIPDFPEPGIVFKDITPLLLDPRALDDAVDGLARLAEPLTVDFVVARRGARVHPRRRGRPSAAAPGSSPRGAPASCHTRR